MNLNESSALESDDNLCGNVEKISTLALATGGLITCLIGLAIYATFRDFKASKNRSDLLSAFSLKKNIKNLFNFDQSTPKDAIHCFHGFRTLSLFSIIYLHTYFFRAMHPSDEEAYNEWMKTGISSGVSTLNIAVDSFFVFSAALSTRTMLKELDHKTFNIFKTIFLRYVRLTPALLIVMLVSNSLATYLNDGAPPTFLDYSAKHCEKFWWSTLLHIQTITNPTEMCMHTTWYISVDWQMTVFVAPILVYLLWRFGKKVLILLLMLIGMSMVHVFRTCFDKGFIAQEISISTDIRGEFYRTIYYPAYIRGSPFLIGIIFGYFLHTKKGSGIVKFQSTQIATRFLSLIALVTPATAAIFFMVIGRNITLNALFLSSIRNIWGFGAASICFVCHFGGCTTINKFVAHKLWMPMAKLGFCLYLVHPVLQYNLIASRENLTNLDTIPMIWNFITDLILSTIGAIILHLLVEEPFSAVAKHVSKRWNQQPKVTPMNDYHKSSESSEMTEQGKFSFLPVAETWNTEVKDKN